MPKPRIPLSLEGGFPVIELSSDEWALLEAITQKPIDSKNRTAIVRTMGRYQVMVMESKNSLTRTEYNKARKSGSAAISAAIGWLESVPNELLAQNIYNALEASPHSFRLPGQGPIILDHLIDDLYCICEALRTEAHAADPRSTFLHWLAAIWKIVTSGEMTVSDNCDTNDPDKAAGPDFIEFVLKIAALMETPCYEEISRGLVDAAKRVRKEREHDFMIYFF